MTTSITYPDGATLASSALTVPQMNVIMQAWTLAALGVIPPDYSRVRVDWPTEGQPFASSPSQDVCFVQCATQDNEYSRIRDLVNTGTGPVLETWNYTSGWRVAWCAYGPNATDNTRAIKSALFLDYFTDQLSLNNLFPLPDPPNPTYLPENFNALWWARSDFHVDLYENVTETLTTPTGGFVTSVEIKVYNGAPSDPVADFTVHK
jgi:hypothetical protein